MSLYFKTFYTNKFINKETSFVRSYRLVVVWKNAPHPIKPATDPGVPDPGGFAPSRQLVVSGDTSSCHSMGEGAAWHPTAPRMPTAELLAPDLSSEALVSGHTNLWDY